VSADDRQTAIELVEQAVTSGARRAAACAVLGISLRTLQRWQTDGGTEDHRHGPTNGPGNALSQQERALVVSIASSPRYRDLAPSQIVPKLADAGIYVASEASFYRILRGKKLLHHRGSAAERTNRRPGQHVADGPNQVWSWDITYLRSAVRGLFYYLYLILDVWSRKIVGWAVHAIEDNELAARLIGETALHEQIDPGTLVLHSDNGGPMKGATMLATLQWLGIMPSFSRPRVSNDNAFSESLFGTVKGWPGYPSKPFDGIEAAREWTAGFVGWYNNEHLHSGIRFVTPADRHCGRESQILENRRRVYQAARAQNPSRWTRATRNWAPVEQVVLNAEKVNREYGEQEMKSA
jgi:transposase InsO family protein